MDKSLIRNFSIIAHIDHGKSTLADRLLLKTGAISQREFHDQMLDGMDLERERGITIKAKAVRLRHKAGGIEYILNLIDTPGHVDFTYEVSKALAACEGVLLVVDAAQGVEAQTVANLYLAREHNLVIIPVINKIDLAERGARKGSVRQLRETLHLTDIEPIMASAKSGIGVEEIMQAIVDKIPSPNGEMENPLQALIIDSAFDTFKGVVVYIRLKNGSIIKGMKIKMMGTGRVYDIEEVGVFKPAPVAVDELSCGEVGYITCNIKDPKEVHVGDTITDFRRPAADVLPGYKKVRPLVFCGLYPVNAKDFPFLRDALEKMELSDSSFIYEVESSVSFGFGIPLWLSRSPAHGDHTRTPRKGI